MNSNTMICLLRMARDKDVKYLNAALKSEVNFFVHVAKQQRTYSGVVLPFVLSFQDKVLSSSLLQDKELTKILKSIDYANWLLQYVDQDPKSFLWGLQNGWGTIIRCGKSSIPNYVLEEIYKKTIGLADVSVEQRQAWDSWIRSSMRRGSNAYLTCYLCSPTRQEMLEWAKSEWTFLPPAHFWTTLSVQHPDIYKKVLEIQQMTHALGAQWGRVEAQLALQSSLGWEMAVESLSVDELTIV